MNKDRTIETYSRSRQAYHLFLDDVRMPADVAGYIVPLSLRSIYLRQGWVIVRSYEAFVQYILENGMPGMISFDHDLDAQSERGNPSGIMTGYDCAKWLINHIEYYHLSLPVILCHSMNPPGKRNIEVLFEGYQRNLLENRQLK